MFSYQFLVDGLLGVNTGHYDEYGLAAQRGSEQRPKFITIMHGLYEKPLSLRRLLNWFCYVFPALSISIELPVLKTRLWTVLYLISKLQEFKAEGSFYAGYHKADRGRGEMGS